MLASIVPVHLLVGYPTNQAFISYKKRANQGYQLELDALWHDSPDAHQEVEAQSHEHLGAPG